MNSEQEIKFNIAYHKGAFSIVNEYGDVVLMFHTLEEAEAWLADEPEEEE